VTASGESLPSALGLITTTVNQANPVRIGTPVGDAGSPYASGGLTGLYSYQYTWQRIDNGLETAPTPASPVVDCVHYRVNLPLNACEDPPAGFIRRWYRGTGVAPPRAMASYGAVGGTNLHAGVYAWVVSFVTATGETAAVNAVTIVIGGDCAMRFLDVPTGPSGVTARKIYRTPINGGTSYRFVGTLADNVTVQFIDTVTDAALGVPRPTAGTAVNPTSFKLLPASQNPAWWVEVSGKLVDTLADASLGSTAPTASGFTGSGQQIAVKDISKGPTGTTSRKLYRTVVGGAQLKLQATLADNTTTTLTDATPDGSLGANAPTVDASALSQPSGQVLAGASSLILAATAGFTPTGGWAVIGNGQQVIRYTGISGLSLIGIPFSGPGAITASVSFNSSVTESPALTGVSGITRPIKQGDAVNLLVQLDDTVAQSSRAAAIGGDGVVEEYMQDGRLGRTEAVSRARAKLVQQSLPLVTVTYRCRDRNTHSGQTVTINLPTPAVSAAFKIQRVVISHFGPHVMPTYTVTASSARFSFENLIRLMRGTL